MEPIEDALAERRIAPGIGADATQIEGMAMIRIRLLGHLHVEVGGRPVERLLSGRARSVLQKLVLAHPRPVPRDVLLDLLWQDMEPERARNNLNVAISAIRRAMSDGSVVEFDRGRATYGFSRDRDLWVDVLAFEQHIARARAAQGSGNIEGAVHAYQLAGQLYVGDLLADQPYEAWIESERNDLRRRWLDGLGALGRLLHDAGQTDEAIWSFEHATRIDPFDEAALQKWMSAVADRGQWRRALEAYERYRIKLSDELGLLPSRALRTTANEIMVSAGVLSA